ncbi:MAG: hypothetical protein ACLU6Y_07255 [Ruminococcus sp.]
MNLKEITKEGEIMAHTSEYEIEDIFIDCLEGIGYKFIKLNNYDEVLAKF